ncbi:asparagine synthase (glutamine-hydrolyzing) [Shewanella indica]|uniref:asparagine synthase (glutamine-hydrolyzing) n=1 Tax=Shewanella indica TaxID=768528 RepID=UPI003D35EFA9
MCGISGFFSFSDHSEDLHKSLTMTSHRGPDSSGTYKLSKNGVHVGLGHNRLSILDLSDNASQPMKHPDGVVLVFNGEIYNYSELKKKYLSHVDFCSASDTEVLLNLYMEFGCKAFAMLEGMFSFSILDERTNCLYLVRDSLGIKPVYYVHNDEGFAFCSEIKGLAQYSFVDKVISSQQVYEFLNSGFVYEPNTGFEYIVKVPPSSFLLIDIDSGEIEVEEYTPIIHKNNELNLENELRQAVKRQLVSDVPLGVFFSGGIDSSILAMHAEDSELIFAEYSADASSDLDKQYSEEISSHLCKKLTKVSIKDDEKDLDSLLEQIRFVVRGTEEPISDYTFWSTYKLSRAAKESGYTVMLSGMGGDELYAGYPRYFILKYKGVIKLFFPFINAFYKMGFFPGSFDKKMTRLRTFANDNNFASSYTRLVGYFSEKDINQLYKSDIEQERKEFLKKLDYILDKSNSADPIKKAQHLDKFGFLSHNLSVSDKASMLASIELRVPLLSESLVSIAQKLPSKKMVNGFSGKLPLLECLYKKLPKRLFARPKTGFNPPLDTLINNLGKDELKRQLLSDTMLSAFNSDYMNGLIDEHFLGLSNNSYKLWQLVYLKFWLEENA